MNLLYAIYFTGKICLGFDSFRTTTMITKGYNYSSNETSLKEKSVFEMRVKRLTPAALRGGKMALLLFDSP